MDIENQKPLILWHYIEMENFTRPPGVATETVRSSVSKLWAGLRRNPTKKTPLITQNVYQPLSIAEKLSEKVVSQIEWNESVSALSNALEICVDDGQNKDGGQVVVGAPYTGTSETITRWAILRGYFVVQPPPLEPIIKGDDTLLLQLEGNPLPLVIPNLERWYLRHPEGLSLIRRLVDWLQSSHRCVLIGCDSWAWAYLSSTLQVNTMFPPPLTLKAFDHERLQLWFRSLSTSSDKSVFIFRQSDNGEYIIEPPQEISKTSMVNGNTKPGATKKSVNGSDFLKNLAAYCHGNPGVAWSIWRDNLQFVADEKVDEDIKKIFNSGSDRIIWVKPWPQLKLPKLIEGKQIDLIVLHSLLVHGGLPVKLLPQLLPFSGFDISQTLHNLSSAGLIEIEQDIFRVTSLGYPSVREKLEGEGYLVDSL